MKLQLIATAMVVFVWAQLHAQVPIPKQIAPPSADGFYKMVKQQEAYFAEHPDDEVDGEYARFKRWQWFWTTRVQAIGDQNGSFDHVALAMVKSLHTQTPICPSSTADPSNWKSLGPDSYYEQRLGLINDLWVHPDNLNYMLAAAKLGGVFQTFDGGQTWKNITDNARLPYIDVRQIVEVPNGKHDSIYIATGFYRNDRKDLQTGIGVLQTSDGGKTWKQSNLSYDPQKRMNVLYLLMHPTNHQIMYANVLNAGNYYPNPDTTEIYMTRNGGLTWQPLMYPANANKNASVSKLHFLPSNPNILLVPGKRLYSYNSITNQWKDLTPNMETSVYQDSIFATYLGFFNSDMYAFYFFHKKGSVFESADYGQMRYSQDNGASWKLYANSVSGLFFDGAKNYKLNISPENRDIMYFGAEQGVMTKGINDPNSNAKKIKYTDEITGYTDSLNGVLIHADIRSVHLQNRGIPPSSAHDTLIISTDGGVAKTFDGGAHWQDITGKGLNVANIMGLGTSEQSPDLIVSGGWDNGYYTFNGSSWEINSNIGDAEDFMVDKIDARVAYGQNGQSGKGLVYSINSGQTYPYNLTSPSGNGNISRPFLMRAHTLYIGHGDVYKGKRVNASKPSSDPLWQKISSFASTFGAGTEPLQALAVSPSDTNVMYAAKNDPYWENPVHAKFFKTTNGGTTWTNITDNVTSPTGVRILGGLSITDIIVHPQNPNEVWIGLAGFDEVHRVYHSTDGGSIWENVSEGLPYFPVNCLEVYNCGGTPILFAGTDVGVFFKRPNETWQCFNNNLPVSMIVDLEVTYSNNKLRAASCGRGIWETDLSTLAPIMSDVYMRDIPSESGLEPDQTANEWWISDDIWVRQNNDGGTVHQNPVYRPGNSAPNYVNVKILNRGCAPSKGTDTLKTYWSKASTTATWPKPWDGSVNTPAKMGAPLSPVVIPVIAPYDSVTLRIPWFPPSPHDYQAFGKDSSHFCLLARIETSPTIPYGMTFPETADLYSNTKNNNNIVWKNISIIDSATGKRPGGHVTVGNPTADQKVIRFDFSSPPAGLQTVMAYYSISVNLGIPLMQQWVLNGTVGNGVAIAGAGILQITDPNAWIGNITIPPGKMYNVSVYFSPLPNVPVNASAQKYFFDLKQTDQLGQIAGERFVISAPPLKTIAPIAFRESNNEEENKKQREQKESFDQNGLSVYPNPAHKQLFVSNSNMMNETEVRIYTMWGSEVYKSVFKGSHTIDISALARSVYVVKIWDQKTNLQSLQELIVE